VPAPKREALPIERWDAGRDGPLSEAALRRSLEARGYRVARYVYPPGIVFPEHTHAVDKIDVVLAGRFRMTTPEGEAVLGPGDALAVPRGTVHRAEVVGDEPVVSLDATRAGRPEA
jgi:quercetin dioxygenase-like cupin family protein